MSDAVIGIKGKDFVVLGADAGAGFSIILMKHDEDKIANLDTHKIMACNGENGDRVQFSEFIQKNLALYKFSNNTPTSMKASSHYIRGELAKALRKAPYNTNLLLGGVDFDKDQNPSASLYFIDYLASMQELPFGAHGYGSFFILGLLDKYYRPDMSKDEVLSLLKLCINEIQSRLMMNTPNFIVKVVDKDGVHKIDISNVQPLENIHS